jgi:phosphate-selective porin OprO and OprP
MSYTNFFLKGMLVIGLQCFLFAVNAQTEQSQVPNGTDGLVLEVRDSTTLRIDKLPPNEFEGSRSTFKIGLGLIYDLTTYSQTDEFKSQMDSLGFSLGPTANLRDFRILGSGRLKTKRAISWKFAYMWDGDNKTWLVRESGVTFGVPELAGHIFIGRTKEGFSMVKVMNGHSPWTSERQMATDLVPIIADGIKWFGFLPKSRVFWNIGAFNDFLSKGQKFSTFSWQVVGRIGWMPFYDPERQKLMHVAANLRYGRPFDGKITLKSRPESNNTPQILNTGAFNTNWSTHTGAELYYSHKKLMVGSEIVVHKFHSSESDNHTFYGGDVVVSYFFTRGVRPYNTVGSIYAFIPVKNSVFKGGLGELEGVLRFSTFNLNDGSVQGGQFWKITPMINWYMSKVMRVEFIYGYGILDRLEKEGAVHFFESRIQFTIM